MSPVRQACIDVFTPVALAIVLLGPVAVRAEESPALQRGHNLYSEHCMMCHGVAGAGTARWPPSFAFRRPT